MRLMITFKALPELRIKYNYNEIINGLLLSSVPASMVKEIKESRLKFCFSWLLGRPEHAQRENRMVFRGTFQLIVASGNHSFLYELIRGFYDEPTVRIASAYCKVVKTEIYAKPALDLSGPIGVRALSPILVYTKEPGQNERHFLSPINTHENPQDAAQHWSRALLANLVTKSGMPARYAETELKDAFILPDKVGEKHSSGSIAFESGGIYRGWKGRYHIKLPESFFWLAYDYGLGAKNAFGFGLIEPLKVQSDPA